MDGIKLPYSPMQMSQMANPYAGQTFAQYYQPIQNMAMQTEKMDMLRADRAQAQTANRMKAMEEQAYKQELSRALGEDVTSLSMDDIRTRILPVLAKRAPEKAIQMMADQQKKKGGDIVGLRSRMNSVQSHINYLLGNGYRTSDPEVKDKVQELEALKNELATAETPSLRNVYSKLYGEIPQEMPPMEPTAPEGDDVPVDVDMQMEDIITNVIDAQLDYDEAGSLKNRRKIERDVRKEVKKRGLTPDVEEDLLSEVEKAETLERTRRATLLDRAGTVQAQKIRSKSEKRAESSDKISQDKSFQVAWNAMNDLKQRPNDVTTKRMALNVKLRDESGAAIGAEEFTNMMSFVLPESAYKDFVDETTGLGAILVGLAGDDARVAYMKRIVEKYLDRVDAQKLINYIDNGISGEYWRRSESKKSKSKPKAKQTKKGTFGGLRLR
jgi:hypothetical protein